MYIKELYMENVHSAALMAIEAINKDLKNINISLTEQQEDDVYIAIDLALERISNGNYRHEH
jgi:hypothetical protein